MSLKFVFSPSCPSPPLQGRGEGPSSSPGTPHACALGPQPGPWERGTTCRCAQRWLEWEGACVQAGLVVRASGQVRDAIVRTSGSLEPSCQVAKLASVGVISGGLRHAVGLSLEGIRCRSPEPWEPQFRSGTGSGTPLEEWAWEPGTDGSKLL